MTPQAFLPAQLNLSYLVLIAFAALLAVAVAVGMFYCLFGVVLMLAPSSVEGAESALEIEWSEQYLRSMISVVLAIAAVSLLAVISAIVFLYGRARAMDRSGTEPGMWRRLFIRYFYRRPLTGLLLALISWPVLVYFLFDVSLLLSISPAARRALTRFEVPGAEGIYFWLMTLLSSWLLFVLLAPAAWLALRLHLLRWRYTVENPGMALLFSRTLKQGICGLLAIVGGGVMAWWADLILRFVVALQT